MLFINKSKELLRDRTFKRILILFIALKILILFVGISSQIFIPSEYTKRQMVTSNILLNPWAQYDAQAYLDIAKNGYRMEFADNLSNYGWYPLYPLLIKLFSFMSYELAAFLISNICSFLIIVLLYVLVKEEFNNRIAHRTIFYLLLFPTAYFFTAMYTESLFLFLLLVMFLAARKEKWYLVGVTGFLLSLTRMQGVFLIFPMLYLYFSKRNFKIRKMDRNVLYLSLFILGMSLFLAYHYFITGNPFAQFYTQYKFRSISPPWVSFENAIIRIIEAPTSGIAPMVTEIFYNSFNLLITICFMVLCYLSHKLLRQEYTIYFAISLLLPIISSTLEAISRFALVIFPAFMVMAIKAEDERIHKIFTAVYVISFILLILFTVRHANTMLFGIDWSW